MLSKANSIRNLLFLVFSTVLLVWACSNEDRKNLDIFDELQADTLDAVPTNLVECDTFPEIKYTRIFIADQEHLSEIRKMYNSNNVNDPLHRIIITLNRKEFRFIRVKDTIIVPDTIVKDLLAYSVFPQCYPAAHSIPKLVIVSNQFQSYGCYEYGKLVRFSAANTGKETTPTFPGRYALVWKERVRRSSLDSNWVMPFTWNFHPHAGNAFHQFEMPGRPVSHSCVRQFMEDAEWLYNWGSSAKRDTSGNQIYLSGTPVLIVDIFDFKRKTYGPWLDLKSNRELIATLPSDPMQYEEALIPYCQIPLDARGSLVNQRRFVHAEDTLRARGVIREGVNLVHTRNFNKERREKREQEERERMKRDSIQKIENTSFPNLEQTSDQIDKDNGNNDDNEIDDNVNEIME